MGKDLQSQGMTAGGGKPSATPRPRKKEVSSLPNIILLALPIVDIVEDKQIGSNRFRGLAMYFEGCRPLRAVACCPSLIRSFEILSGGLCGNSCLQIDPRSTCQSCGHGRDLEESTAESETCLGGPLGWDHIELRGHRFCA